MVTHPGGAVKTFADFMNSYRHCEWQSGRILAFAGMVRRELGRAANKSSFPTGRSLVMRQVVVTGGGTGIEVTVAGEFVRAGDSVTITGRREHVLKEAVARLAATAERSGGAAAQVCFDASDPVAVSAALDLLPTRVDVLVNNAGGNTDFDRAPVRDGDLPGLAAAWRANLDANLLSAVLVTAALAPRLAQDARIISTADVAATVMFLASPAAGHLTGQVIHVNGGAYLGR
jgi:NAD(P)-dependent dehydrogenase (short-subunit alcohol dehydrogenase family)